jgi:hypothetical protein
MNLTDQIVVYISNHPVMDIDVDVDSPYIAISASWTLINPVPWDATCA